MSKQETNHLLKIKKKDYPQIFDFLENVPKGTKTAHIREALIRYINDLGGSPPIPFNNKLSSNKANDVQSINYEHAKLLSEPNEERKKEIREAIKQENIKQYRKKSEEEDEHEELIDLDVNQL